MRVRLTLIVGRTIFTIAVLALIYVVAGLGGGAIAVNRDWTPPADGIEIFVESNGIHTGIVMPVHAAGIDWSTVARPDHLRDRREAARSHVAIGWGQRDFYLDTPRWQDIDPAIVLAAAIGSDRTVMHVEHVDRPEISADRRLVLLRPDEYRRLAAFVRSGFGAGMPVAPGYGRADAFYNGRGTYSAINTCNAWTGAALREAGVRMGAWTPFAASVIGWF